MGSGPLLSLITGKVGRDAEFQRLFNSIVDLTTVDWELIVADASDQPFASTLSNVKVIHEKPRQTHVKGYNAAFRQAKGKYLLWLNDDAEVCPGYDVESVGFMESHPKIGLGCLHYSENGGEFHVNSAWQVVYANFGIFPKWLGEQVGYFDEAIIMYGADNSLAIKILLADRGIADIPKARILHHSEKDSVREDNQKYRSRDNRTLHDTYMPSRRYWLATYKKYFVHGQPEPWPHGVNPKSATAGGFKGL